jgi:CDI immunity proteins
MPTDAARNRQALATQGTIEEIEGVSEPAPAPDATTLARRCLALRRKPLPDFTAEDLRIMIGQQLALPVLLPLAVAVLADNPLAEGDYYPGDLLHAVVRLPETAWHGASSQHDRLIEVLRAASLPAEDTDSSLRDAIAALIDSSAS